MAKVLLLYHYFHPDDVAGALQFTGLGEGLVQKRFEVESWPCNHSCHHEEQTYSLKPERVGGVLVRRVWRPAFNQHRFLGRILNSAWVEMSWFFRALFSNAPDALIIGTDPIFAVLLIPFLKLRWPRTKFIHWCFDLYPDYALAEGIVKENGLTVRLLRKLLHRAYGVCDLVVDLGSCMRQKLDSYPIRKRATLTPWALVEPVEAMETDPVERELLFGKNQLGFLYSGNLSHPHRYALILVLARKMGNGAVFAFSARGNRVRELKSDVGPEDTNIRFVPFAPPDKLLSRLTAPDIHLVSLRSSYTGIAVPSKFFGALAVGRPVLFEGDENSAIAGWIKEHQVGWVVVPGKLAEVEKSLKEFSSDPERRDEMFRRCFRVYQEQFSKKAVLNGWENEIKKLLKA
jgi:glycosyltransferase involved in cell wall biosynthesis